MLPKRSTTVAQKSGGVSYRLKIIRNKFDVETRKPSLEFAPTTRHYPAVVVAWVGRSVASVGLFVCVSVL